MGNIPFSGSFAVLCLVAAMSMVVVPVQGADLSNGEQGEVVTGVLTEYDKTEMHASVQTDVERVERVVRVKVINQELFQRLSIGTRISVRINDRGEALKVIEVPLPELQTPVH
ncbi:MAG: hypothetical protein Q7U39_15070 [Nitrospira sp.]|nr:hypothetical protein [Nitrospira sp.]